MTSPSIPISLGEDLALPLYDGGSPEGAIQLDPTLNLPDNAVVRAVQRPWLFGYNPTVPSNGRAVLIFGGGGYIELMAGREGVQVARWLAGLGFHAFVLVHRFPTAETGVQAPLDDARQALRLIKKQPGLEAAGLGVCGLSSGGHLASALLAEYPSTFTESTSTDNITSIPGLDFAIIGYGPISTNAKGRTIIPDKAALAPPEKQAFYDAVQPDANIISPAPPTFIVYSANDPIVPVINAYRLTEGITKAGGAVELHVFADAPHGFALDAEDLPVSNWPSMCVAWLKQNGML